jgi:hypothetical protein
MSPASATLSSFRRHIDPEWNPEAEPEIEPLSVIARDHLPISGSSDRVPIDATPPEVREDAPFAYRVASPVLDPPVAPELIPRLSAHRNVYAKYQCDGNYWHALLYYGVW